MRLSAGGRPAVIVAGSIYCDLIFHGLNAAPTLGEEVRTHRFALTLGGGGYITAVGLARLGLRAALRAYVGRDPLGEFQLDALRRERVDVSLVSRHARLGTPISVAFSTTADRGFMTYKGCAVDTGRLLRRWPRHALRGVRHVHFAGMRPPFRACLPFLSRLRAAGITTSLDIGWNPEVYRSKAFREVIRGVTIFMPSWRDAQWLTGRDRPRDAVRVMGEMVAVPVIKLGARGAIGLDHGRPLQILPPHVRTVETTGAGDAFDAGFIWAFLRGEPIERCLWAGNVCGAYTTRAAGGTAAFPRRREVMALMRRKGLR
jgi:sugar/nucleoside kinase (ribokinase family)